MKFLQKSLILFTFNLLLITSGVSAEGKTLVVFYSSTGNTKAVCAVFSKDLGADLTREEVLYEAEKLIPAIKVVFWLN